jgi:hypothetical protein
MNFEMKNFVFGTYEFAEVRKPNSEGQNMHIRNFFNTAHLRQICMSVILRKFRLTLHMPTSAIKKVQYHLLNCKYVQGWATLLES